MAAEAASFNTSIVSISSGLILAEREFVPRTLIFTPSPGAPLVCITCTPATLPTKACPAVAAERDNSLALTLAKEPVKSLLRIGV